MTNSKVLISNIIIVFKIATQKYPKKAFLALDLKIVRFSTKPSTFTNSRVLISSITIVS